MCEDQGGIQRNTLCRAVSLPPQEIIQGAAKPSGGFLRRCGRGDGGHDCESVGARFHDGPYPVRRDSRNRDHGNGDRPAHLGETVNAFNGRRISLRRGGKDRAETDVVRPCGLGVNRLRRGSSRRSDNETCSEDAPCVRHREVRLAEMYALRAGGQRDVDPVVDEQWHAGLGADGLYPCGFVQHVPDGLCFMAELNGVRAAADSQPGQLSVAEPLLEVKVREDVKASEFLVLHS